LSATDVVEEAALDKYEFIRDAYIQKRDNDVNDGEVELDDDIFE
jgi:phospholipid-binding lipoprotein MlaA